MPSAIAACKLCIAEKGIAFRDIDDLPMTDEDLWKHIETEHHIPVKRDGENDAQAYARLWAEHPEAKDPKTCKCPDCRAKRRGTP